jgi:hypothetical protein
MTEEKYYWESIEQLLDEAKKVHILEIEYNDKNFKLAWKEIMESTDLDMDIPDKSYSEMNIKEKQDFNIKEAGEVEGCFNKNKIDKMMWSKFPSRLKALVINELFQVNKALEKRF